MKTLSRYSLILMAPLVLTSCTSKSPQQEEEKTFKDQVKQAVQEVKTEAHDAASKVATEAKKVAQDAKDVAHKAADSAKKAISKATDKAQELYDSLTSKDSGMSETAKKEINPNELYIETLQANADPEAKSPQAGNDVTVHYTGWVEENGQKTIFDSSLNRGTPFTFTIGKGYVIKGWDEGVMGMKEGEKRLLVIPPHLAYGDRGAGNVIKPGATLHFEVELIKVS